MPPTRRSCRRAGRTFRTRSSRRSRSGLPCSQWRRAASRKSFTTARTACSSQPATRRRSAEAVRRYFADDALRRAAARRRCRVRRRVRAGTRLRRARANSPANCGRVKPRVLFVSRRVELPLSPSLARKWDASAAELDFRVLAGGSGGRRRVPSGTRPLPALDGPAFFAALPLRIARELRTFRPHAVLAQGAHETAAALSARKLARDGHGRDRRRPWRLAGADAPLRLAAARRAEPGRGPGRARCASRSRRHPNGDRLHHGARARASGSSRPTSFPPTWTSTRSSRSRRSRSRNASAGALRRRARALQERRRARRSVAAGRAARPGGAAAPRRHRDVATDRRAARSRSTRRRRLGHDA